MGGGGTTKLGLSGTGGTSLGLGCGRLGGDVGKFSVLAGTGSSFGIILGVGLGVGAGGLVGKSVKFVRASKMDYDVGFTGAFFGSSLAGTS